MSKKRGCMVGSPKSLQMQGLETLELIDQAGEIAKVHEGRRAIRRAILAKLDWAHRAAQVALSDRLDLDVFG